MTANNLKSTTLGIFFLLISSTGALAQGTTFTYQGRLADGATPANGTYDMRFRLFDTNGNQIGSTITQSTVAVTNGVFTVTLDYGAVAFSGNDRLLEIGIRPAGNGDPYTILNPRQPVTSTPYAIRAANTTTADTAFNANKLGGVNADQYVLTTDPRLVNGANSFIQNTNTKQTANFNISGTGQANLFLSNEVRSDSIDSTTAYKISNRNFVGPSGFRNTVVGFDAGLAAQEGEDHGSNTLVGFAAGRGVIGGFNTFVGTFAGSESENLGGDTFVGYLSGVFNTTAEENSFFGTQSGRANTTGQSNSFFGHFAGKENKTAGDNSLFGALAGSKSTGASNSFFGSHAGGNNLTGFANSFFGLKAGESNQSGFNHAFFGRGAGAANVGGNNHTLIGTNANVSSPNLSFATAIGSDATVGTSNTIVLGRSNGADGVQVPGTLTVKTLGTAGVGSLCLNVLSQIANCSSSLRYKQALAPFTGGLALLSQLHPITFSWKSDNSRDLGFGAEDVASVEPLLATRNELDQVEGVKYDRITAVLVNAVKELQAQIVQQQLLLQRQQAEIRGLKRLGNGRRSGGRR